MADTMLAALSPEERAIADNILCASPNYRVRPALPAADRSATRARPCCCRSRGKGDGGLD
jgi:hypothetical protein